MLEIWRSIYCYEVSTAGQVRNRKTGIMPKLCNRNGYLGVSKYSVHRLVGMAFPDLVSWTEDAKGKPFEELQINHKNEVKTDNRVENLEWCTMNYNLKYGTRLERIRKKVYQYTLDGELVKQWVSLKECKDNGFNRGSISACCRGEKKAYKGFKWSYLPLSV